MAFFFNAPDFYNMAKDRQNRFDKQIDDFVQSGPFMQYARSKEEKAARAAAQEQLEYQRKRDAEYDKREQLRLEYMTKTGRFAPPQQPPEQPPEQMQQTPEAMQQTPEQMQQAPGQMRAWDYIGGPHARY
jgi:hypothetical protein